MSTKKSDRISAGGDYYRRIADYAFSTFEDLKEGTVDPTVATVQARHLNVAARAGDADLRSRMFDYRMTREV